MSRNSKSSRRLGGRRVMNVNGTTRALPFETRITNKVLAAAAGTNVTTMTIADLINGDLVGRVVKLISCEVRFHPYNQATQAAANFSAQLFYVDAATPATVPMTEIKPLSATNAVTLSAIYPFQNRWYPVTSTNDTLTIKVWSESAFASGIIAEIKTRWYVAQDSL